MKMKENDATGRKRRKIIKLYIFHEKKHENESCAVFRADIGGPVGKNMIFWRSIRAGSGPVPIAPIGIPMGPDRLPIRFRNSF